MNYQYVGTELELFANAVNWKKYFSESIRPYVCGQVLEVGAGAGANTKYMINSDVESWTALEPDPELYRTLAANLASLKDGRVKAVNGFLADLKSDERNRFDSILYIDVLEHIEKDSAELGAATALLKPGGKVVVLSPAHSFFYSEFDRAIGHFRRYNKRSLSNAAPEGLKLARIWYLDSVGCAASCANKLLLKQGTPTLKQILFWDRVLVRLSRIADLLSCHLLGKSIIAVWTRAS